MTIHHDKLAYGKLAPTSENLSEERLAQMLAQLNGLENRENCGEEDAAEDCAEQSETSENGAYQALNSNKKRKK